MNINTESCNAVFAVFMLAVQELAFPSRPLASDSSMFGTCISKTSFIDE